MDDSSNRTGFTERKVAALLEANRAILQETDFASAARRIFDACCDLTGCEYSLDWSAC